MRIQYCSDLHLEFEKNKQYLNEHPLEIVGEVLILAGDVAPLHDEFLLHDFFKFVDLHYQQVFWVPGNHEFYYKDISKYKDSYHIKIMNRINIVHNVALTLGNIHFVFSTLWSKIHAKNAKKIEAGVSDFHCIGNGEDMLTAPDFNVLHRKSLDFVTEELAKKIKNTVVVTHHLPTALANDKQHANSPINEAFCVDLTHFIKKCGASFWIYGHSHYNQTPLYLGKTILLTNQLGYVHRQEHLSFKHNAYFSL